MTTRRRIILHWTAGKLHPNTEELKHYHYLIDSDAGLHLGLYRPEDNDNCKDGHYAPHAGGGNTRSIGVAFCGMMGFVSKSNPGNQLLTRKQVEKGFHLCALLLQQEGHDQPTHDNLMTHYELGLKNPLTDSKGKIDIIYLPPFEHLAPEEIGHFIRQKTAWYLNKVIRKGAL